MSADVSVNVSTSLDSSLQSISDLDGKSFILGAEGGSGVTAGVNFSNLMGTENSPVIVTGDLGLGLTAGPLGTVEGFGGAETTVTASATVSDAIRSLLKSTLIITGPTNLIQR